MKLYVYLDGDQNKHHPYTIYNKIAPRAIERSEYKELPKYVAQ